MSGVYKEKGSKLYYTDILHRRPPVSSPDKRMNERGKGRKASRAV
jgi:hypothetical protein